MGCLRILYIAVLLLTLGCGQEKPAIVDGNAIAQEDPFFRLWTAEDGSRSVDLTGASFDYTSEIRITEASLEALGFTEQCICDITMPAFSSSGQTYLIHNCGYDSATVADPGCYNLNESGSYSFSAGELIACKNGTQCLTYR